MNLVISVFILCLLPRSEASAADAVTKYVSKDHPISGVITMLQKLIVDAKDEGEVETAMFNKYTYWCKRSTRKLERAMKRAQKRIGRLTDQSNGLQKEIDTLTYDIDGLTKQIGNQQVAQVKARQKLRNETNLYDETTKNIIDTVYAIEDAIVVMTDAEEVGWEETDVEVDYVNETGNDGVDTTLKEDKRVARPDREPRKLLSKRLFGGGDMFLGLKHDVNKQSLRGRKWLPPPAEAEIDESNALEGELEALNNVAAVRASKRSREGEIASSVTGLVMATKKLRKV